MPSQPTPLDADEVCVGSHAECFARAARLLVLRLQATPPHLRFGCAFSGDEPVRLWCDWAASHLRVVRPLLERAHWFVCDERHVRLDSHESHWGHLERSLLRLGGVKPEHRHPWSINLPPALAALEYERTCMRWLGAPPAFDVCLLAFNADGRLGSLPAANTKHRSDGGHHFGANKTQTHDWFLSITPTGLAACGLVIVFVYGAEAGAAWSKSRRLAADGLKHHGHWVSLLDPAAADAAGIGD